MNRRIILLLSLMAMLAMVVVGVMVNVFMLLLPLSERAQSGDTPDTALFAAQLGATAASCFTVIYPILLWIFMTRPKVVQAFLAQGDMASPGLGRRA